MNKIRLKYGENEIELEGSDDFIDLQLNAFHKKIDKTQLPITKIKEDILSNKSSSSEKKLTPAEYFKSKNKTDGISQILIFGKYLEEYQGKSEFSRDEVNAVAKHAKIAKDIHSQYFTNAVKQGLLRFHGKGRYSLTLSAESALSSM